jgi:hypothetical protein
MYGYAAAYVHSFCMLYCVERHVDMPLHTFELMFYYKQEH